MESWAAARISSPVTDGAAEAAGAALAAGFFGSVLGAGQRPSMAPSSSVGSVTGLRPHEPAPAASFT